MESPTQPDANARHGERVLVIMAKAPRAGTVKTRLSPTLPAIAVAELYRCLLDDTLTLAASLAEVTVAVMCPAADVEELTSLVGDRTCVVAQAGDGLAAGLNSVFTQFARGKGRRVAALDSDSPHLPRRVLEEAFDTLVGHDLVVGPTHDGGYYLVGAKSSHPTLFAAEGIGTGRALEGLLAEARVLGLSVGLVDPFYDIDVAEDLARLAQELRRWPARAPRTALWLGEWEARQGESRSRTGAL